MTSYSEENKKLLKEEIQKESPRACSKKWEERILVFVLLSCQTASLCTDTFIFPFFPREAKKKGLTDTQIGIVYSSFEGTRFIMSLVAGHLIGKINPKMLCILGNSGAGAACILFGLGTYAPDKIYLSLCIIIRMLAGSATAILTVSVMTILLKSTSYQTGTMVGMVETVQAAGYACGPTIGAAVYELAGYTSMFWILGGLLLVLSAVQICVVPSIAHEPPVSGEKPSYGIMRIPGVALLSIHCFACRLISSTRAASIPIYLVSIFNTRSSTAGLICGGCAALYLFVCVPMGILVNKGFIYSAMISSWAIDIFISLFIGPSHILDFIFHGKIYLGLTIAMTCTFDMTVAAVNIPPFQAAINLALVNGYKRDSVKTYGMITGMLNSGLGLGAMVGPIASGAITDLADFTWTMTVMAGISFTMLLALSTYLIFMRITGRPLKPDDDVTLNNDHREQNITELTNTDKFSPNTYETISTEDDHIKVAKKLEQCLEYSLKNCTTLSHVQLKQ